jgi:hypothetical protein
MGRSSRLAPAQFAPAEGVKIAPHLAEAKKVESGDTAP